ncbi:MULTISPECIES: ImmA/IrrE family metallo-endopeptidase [unclassified Thioalkalivibrio]|uniref:ImmA/IrrE family metallo-endopeptidase n=1 Tax=unclassified Thioalkalivibrio TaxID=2621013 RepID=UPI00036949CF|nr:MULTISPECIES: ImmA/IrrE family metallo-endopeptidase [unclassified Thioalkalivibrio]
MAQAHINTEMLVWARERAGLEVSVLAKKLAVREERIRDWESGENLPTFRQARQIAHHTHVPFGYLFLREAPADELPLPDLRTVGDKSHGGPSLALKDTVREVLRRQLWYREYQQERDADPVPVVGAASIPMDVDAVVAEMRAHLGVGPHPERGSADDYLRELVNKVEGLGVLVMRNSLVGSDTHRPLRVEEFRGFAIADSWAPVIFINTADVPGARLFTLIHELTHIWIGKSAISDADPKSPHSVERFCNRVAAEFLVPAEEFEPLWDQDTAWEENLPALEAHFHVSQWVIARRANELGLIADDEYALYLRRRLEEFRRAKDGGAVPFPRVQKVRVSKRFAEAVASEALSGRLLLRDAHRLIGIKPAKIAEFARKELAS